MSELNSSTGNVSVKDRFKFLPGQNHYHLTLKDHVHQLENTLLFYSPKEHSIKIPHLIANRYVARSHHVVRVVRVPCRAVKLN